MAKKIGNATVPSNIGVRSEPLSAMKNIRNHYELRIGVVFKYYPIDDPQNISKQYPEYDVYVLEDSTQQTLYRSCYHVTEGGSLNDFGERVLQPAMSALQGKLEFANDIYNLTGSFVLMLCVDGKKDKGMIINHFYHGSGKSNATTAKGIFSEREFKGFNLLIDNEGTYKLELVGIKNDKGRITNAAPIGSKFEIDKNGIITLLDNQSQKIIINRVAKTILISDGSGESILIDKTTKMIQVDVGKDEIHNIGQNLLENIKKDRTTKILGEYSESVELNKIEKSGPRSTTVNGQWTIKASKLNVTASEITMNSSTQTSIIAGVAINLTAPAVNINGVLNVSGLITGTGGLAITGGSGGSITGDLTIIGNINGTGDLSMTNLSASSDITAGGNITGVIVTGTSDVVGGGKSLAAHIHSGVTTGGGNTGGPV